MLNSSKEKPASVTRQKESYLSSIQKKYSSKLKNYGIYSMKNATSIASSFNKNFSSSVSAVSRTHENLRHTSSKVKL
eukprot:CAMPEP_0168345928 /NCGR_PEP_ID=MMETSP0213-20121227/17903_1 /TAXON_ID=151035 /ORGANISM="Euplotes harpa, Strain FSP1.4" /LENGTH=76 /DNA_ID=CAMNT_0008354353 /DNA_START=135 /DNA_END=361 /DNA_ORIENTATION=+